MEVGCREVRAIHPWLANPKYQPRDPTRPKGLQASHWHGEGLLAGRPNLHSRGLNTHVLHRTVNMDDSLSHQLSRPADGRYGGPNVSLVSVTRPAPQGLDQVVRNAPLCSRCGCANPEAMTGVLTRDSRGS